MIKLNVLIACEESQTVCKAFRDLGHNAFSCDLLVCTGGHPEWHIKTDCTRLLDGNCSFITCDGQLHTIRGSWDLIIAHPPCTRLCLSGQRWCVGNTDYAKHKRAERDIAIEFFMRFTTISCSYVAIENPVGIMSTYYRKPDCVYNPYDFNGETECKKTCLWLKGLPILHATQKISVDQRTHNIFRGGGYSWNSDECKRFRSKTPDGVAKAMAKQWSYYILKENGGYNI